MAKYLTTKLNLEKGLSKYSSFKICLTVISIKLIVLRKCSSRPGRINGNIYFTEFDRSKSPLCFNRKVKTILCCTSINYSISYSKFYLHVSK